jgi:hypothetical protein
MITKTPSPKNLFAPNCLLPLGKNAIAVKKLIAGPDVQICTECVALCDKIIEEEMDA